MKTSFSKIATIVCLVAPLAGFAQTARLLTTITNPTPAANELFGRTVAALGSDRVLVRAAGAAYLLSTSGTLLTTFTNPALDIPFWFDGAAAALGSDRVLIGAFGAAYLFSTNGALITTFTNPTPHSGDAFGWSLAAVGSDRVLIGTYEDNTGANAAGSAYLFSTSGTLLTTFTNPTPAVADYFGWSLTAVGSDHRAHWRVSRRYRRVWDGRIRGRGSISVHPRTFHSGAVGDAFRRKRDRLVAQNRGQFCPR